MAEYFPFPGRYLEGREKESTHAYTIDGDPPRAEDGEVPLTPGPGLGAALNDEAVADVEVSSA